MKLYYEIDEVYERVKGCQTAERFLDALIDRCSPDYFHWTDLERAEQLRDLTPYQKRWLNTRWDMSTTDDNPHPELVGHVEDL